MDGNTLDSGNETDVTLDRPGDTVTVRVVCETPDEISLKLQFHGEAGEASVDKTRTFEIKCVDPIEGVQFTGNDGNSGNSGNSGNVKIRTQSRSSKRTIGATAYYRDDDGNVQTKSKNVSVNHPLTPSDFGIDNGRTIIGVEVEGRSGVFERPDNPGNGNFVDTLTQDPTWD